MPRKAGVVPQGWDFRVGLRACLPLSAARPGSQKERIEMAKAKITKMEYLKPKAWPRGTVYIDRKNWSHPIIGCHIAGWRWKLEKVVGSRTVINIKDGDQWQEIPTPGKFNTESKEVMLHGT